MVIISLSTPLLANVCMLLYSFLLQIIFYSEIYSSPCCKINFVLQNLDSLAKSGSCRVHLLSSCSFLPSPTSPSLIRLVGFQMLDEFPTGHWSASTQWSQCDVLRGAAGETEGRRELQEVVSGYSSCSPSLTHCVVEFCLCVAKNRKLHL
jgi:hypothetical protein